MNDLLLSLDNGDVSVLTLLDLSAAFDTIDHGTLLHRLEHVFGIGGVALSWLRTYLSDREHIVLINGVRSAAARIHYGVPQGSDLGPIQFILYVSPLDDIIKCHSTDHHAFAGDIQLQRSCPVDQIHDSISKMQACVDGVKTWMSENKLQLNDSKTEAVLAMYKQLSTAHTVPVSMTVGCADITFSNQVKNLGVTIDSSLSMHQQVTNVCTSAFIELKHIGSIHQYLTMDATKTLISAFI